MLEKSFSEEVLVGIGSDHIINISVTRMSCCHKIKTQVVALDKVCIAVSYHGYDVNYN